MLPIEPERRRRQVAAAAGQDLPRRHRAGPRSSTTSEIKRELVDKRPYGEWLDEHIVDLDDLPERDAAQPPRTDTLLVRQHAFGYTQRGPASPARADGARRPGAARLDGHRHAAGRALEQAAAAVQLLQAALRAGDQPAARRDPRGARDEPAHRPRPRGQPARRDAGARPPAQARTSRSCATPSWRSCARSTARIFWAHTLDMLLDVDEGQAGLERALERICDRGGRGRRRDGVTILILSDRGVDDEPRRRSRGCSPPRRSTTT